MLVDELSGCGFESSCSHLDLKCVTCGVPQRSISGSLLFLAYVKSLPNASWLLDPIMFADDTNLSLNYKDIKHLFAVVKKGASKHQKWFTANKLCLNVEKIKY